MSTPTACRQAPFQIAIVDNDRLVLNLLISLIKRTENLHVCWSAQRGQEGIDKFRRSTIGLCEAPDVIVTDIAMHGMSGIQMSSIIRFEDDHIPILGITSYDPTHYEQEAFHVGMQGILEKENVEKLLTYVMLLANGKQLCREDGSYFETPHIAHERVRKEGKPVFLKLSEKERDVMNLCMRGLSTEQLAMVMHTTTSTVKTYISRAMKKLGVNSRQEAIAKWSQMTGQ